MLVEYTPIRLRPRSLSPTAARILARLLQPLPVAASATCPLYVCYSLRAAWQHHRYTTPIFYETPVSVHFCSFPSVATKKVLDISRNCSLHSLRGLPPPVPPLKKEALWTKKLFL